MPKPDIKTPNPRNPEPGALDIRINADPGVASTPIRKPDGMTKSRTIG